MIKTNVLFLVSYFFSRDIRFFSLETLKSLIMSASDLKTKNESARERQRERERD